MEALLCEGSSMAVEVLSPGIVTLEVAADTLTPVAAALRLGARCAFLLESVEGGVRYGRHSILGVRGRTLSVTGDEATLRGPDGREEQFAISDPLEALRAVLPDAPPARSDLPFPLASGVGYLAYEATARWERVPLPERDPLRMPDAVLHLPDAVIVFDHLAQVARLAALRTDAAADRLAELAELLRRPSAQEAPAALPALGHGVVPDDDEARARFERAVAQLVEEIHAGEMLQTVLARRFSLPTRRSAFDIYRILRRLNPSPYLFYLDLTDAAPGLSAGAEGPAPALVGASPELLVRVHDGEVVTRPIAGTRPRHEDPARDAALEAELRADPKELAEHAMLVDLARNDVGKVATAASVEVPTLRSVERYSHVMHLVSEVRGRLAPGLDAFDALRAAFPAGTVSGAPKVRAMQAIAELEGERRGPYGGTIGFFSPSDVEAAITIRSVLLRDGIAHVQAGAGIVADSTPEREAAEVAAKARATLLAVTDSTGSTTS
jgi:anthranilate synthase component 1